MLGLDKPDDEQVKPMACVMEITVGVLGQGVAGIGKIRH